MNHLLSVANVADRIAIQETNFERVDTSLAFALNPTLVDGVATAIVGPPADDDHYLGELWVDALCAVWRCTVAGAPGTWIQIRPAVVLTADLPVAPPANYLVLVPDGPWTTQYWDGAAWQVP